MAEPRLSQVLEKRKKGYHLEDIPKGEKGKPSQIYEEIQEFKDALKQNNPLMALQELSDTIGAIELYLEKNFQSQITLEDLIKMKNTTKRVFENGKR
ncbi:hypothetical protein HOD29_00780 [archaeon]|nr:hypothetical protein [archaeon]